MRKQPVTSALPRPAQDGSIYAIPGTARTVLKIDPTTDAVVSYGPLFKSPLITSALKRNQFKWLRGIRSEAGHIYGLPCNANAMLKISRAGEVTTFGAAQIRPEAAKRWKWHGGVLIRNVIYGVPCNCEHILKVELPDPATPDAAERVSLIRGPFAGVGKWYGGVVGADGCMYSFPNCATSVMKFDPVTERASRRAVQCARPSTHESLSWLTPAEHPANARRSSCLVSCPPMGTSGTAAWWGWTATSTACPRTPRGCSR